LQSPRPCFSEKICLHPFLRNFPGLKSRQSTSSDGATSTREHHLPASLRTIYRPVCAPFTGQFAPHPTASLRTIHRPVCAPSSGKFAHRLSASLRTICQPVCAPTRRKLPSLQSAPTGECGAGLAKDEFRTHHEEFTAELCKYVQVN
jgi:hypothetical protein